MIKRSRVWQSNDPALDAEIDILFDHLGRHVVSLNVEYLRIDETGKKSEQEFLTICSCFVIAFGEHWFLATAGHIVEDWDKGLKEKSIEIIGCTLADYFGKDAKHHFSTPFPHQDSGRSAIYEPSAVADFALIQLPPFYRTLLEANNVLPIRPSQCVHLDQFSFVKFILFGFPSTLAANKPVKHGDRSSYNITPTLLSAQRIEANEVPDTIALPQCDYPYFLGKIESSQYPDIDGMSGGPIFGLVYEPDKNTEYSLVAIQSSWYSKHGIILGAPAVLFAAIADDVVRAMNAPEADPVNQSDCSPRSAASG